MYADTDIYDMASGGTIQYHPSIYSGKKFVGENVSRLVRLMTTSHTQAGESTLTLPTITVSLLRAFSWLLSF